MWKLLKVPDLEGKAVLVTGASTGIGAAVAHPFAPQSAKVAIHYNESRGAAEALLARIQQEGLARSPRRGRKLSRLGLVGPPPNLGRHLGPEKGSAWAASGTAVISLLASAGVSSSTLVGDQAHCFVLNSGQTLMARRTLDEVHQSLADGSEKLAHGRE